MATTSKRKRYTHKGPVMPTYEEHPHMAKLRMKTRKLGEILNRIYDIANTDLVVFDRDTGLNDYKKNLKFADALDDISKQLVVLSKKCTDQASALHEKITDAEDQKHNIQDIVFVQEVLKEKDKEDIAKNRDPVRFKSSHIYNIKTEQRYTYLSDEQSEGEPSVWPGDADTKFTYKKQNENDPAKFHYSCEYCDDVFRDTHKLRNHISTHHKELFRCMRCSHLSRSEQGFQRHVKTHYGEVIQCKICLMMFDMKSTLTNHLQKHSNEKLTCQKCQRQFGYRQSYLEHVKYRHHDAKSIPCPICKKFFWTPTAMQAHRAKLHGLVKSLMFLESGQKPTKSTSQHKSRKKPQTAAPV